MAQYTKVSNSGAALLDSVALGSGANDWACTYDSNTNLIWEVKTNDKGLRDRDWTYTWYNSNSSTNAGDAGTSNGGNCYDKVNCDIEKFVSQINNLGLCGDNNWHVSTVDELRTLVYCSSGQYINIPNTGTGNICSVPTNNQSPTIDTKYFPNTPIWFVTSSTSYGTYANGAFYMHFDNSGTISSEVKKTTLGSTRLTRSAQSFDFTPDSFSFTNKTNVPASSTITSDPITLSGLSVGAPISIDNGNYQINGGVWTKQVGSAVNGDVVRVQHTTANTSDALTVTTLTIGGVSAKFTSTTASNIAPTADFTPTPSGGNAPLSVSLDASKSTDSDGVIKDYAWSSNNGLTANGKTASMTFTTPGTYTVTLKVTDDKGAPNEKTATITVTKKDNQPPKANFTLNPSGGNAPLKVTLDATGSTDSDGTIQRYAWDSSDGQSALGATATLQFDKPGAYTVKLTVTDNEGKTDQISNNITVSKQAGTQPSVEFSATPLKGPAPLTVNLDASASKDSNTDGGITDYQWSSSNGLSASGKTASLTFNNAGSFKITLAVKNKADITAYKSVDVTVSKPDDSGYIDGVVYDKCSGQALPYAEIHFDGPDLQTFQSSKFENFLGAYSAKLAVGNYTVEVSIKTDANNSKVYQNLKFPNPVQVSKNTTRFADFSLEPQAGCGGNNNPPATTKAIIVAGAGPRVLEGDNAIWPATQELTDKAYRAFIKQGLSSQQIHYFTADKNDLGRKVDDQPVINGVASKDSLEKAITQWAGDVDDVVIYLVSHGDQKTLLIDETTQLSADQLKQWLDSLQGKIKGRVTVIIEACYSGSFVPVLASNKFKRYVISSASADQTAVVSARGAKSFSYFFWDEVVFTGKLPEAYRKARLATGAQILVAKQAQKAVLDATGDGIESPADYDAIQGYCFGQCQKRAGLAPTIIAVAPQDSLTRCSSF